MQDFETLRLNCRFANEDLDGMSTMKAVEYRDQIIYEQHFSNNELLWTLDHTIRPLSHIFPLHIHDFCEIYLFLRGNIDYLVESEIYHMQPNDILIIPAGCVHQTNVRDPNALYERINLWIKYPTLARLSTDTLDLRTCLDNAVVRQNHLLPAAAPENEFIRVAMMQLIRLQTGDYFGKEISNGDFLRQIVIYAYNYCIRVASAPQRQVLRNPLVAAAIDEINSHLSDPITLEAISNTLFVSKYHLAHTFKQHMGISLHQYVIGRRLANAKEMIDAGSSLNAVCTECGFSNYSNFYKIFKSRVGMSPTEYQLYRLGQRSAPSGDMPLRDPFEENA